jgi:NAD-dependent SIR2 family protein deacetylase
MDTGARLDTTVGAPVVILADEAREGRLTICAGAGISIPAGLPTGPELAGRLHQRFQRVTDYECASPGDLLSVADAAAQLPDGLTAVQRVVLDLAPFSEVSPQLAHHLLALLLAEDALRVLLTNWDDCVERSWRDESEYIQAARNGVEAENLRGQFILKIHGCCTQPETLLITSDQLSDAPLWTRIYFQAELARSTMVFVGIGDVAD